MTANGELSLTFDTRSLFRIGLAAFLVGDGLGTPWLLSVNRLLDLQWYQVDAEALPMFFGVGLWCGAITTIVALGLLFLRQPRPAKVAWDGARITLFDGETPKTSIAWVNATLGTMTTYIKASKYSDKLSYVGSVIQIRGEEGEVIELSEGTQPFWLNGHKTSTPFEPLLPLLAQLPKVEMKMRSFNTTALAWVVAIGAYVCAGLGLGALSHNYGNDLDGVRLLCAGAVLFLLRTLYTAGTLRKTPATDHPRRRALRLEIGARILAAPVLAVPALLWFLVSSAPPQWTEVHPIENRMVLSSDGKLVFFYRAWELHLAEVATKQERAMKRLDADYGIDFAAVSLDGSRVAIQGRDSSIQIWRPGSDELMTLGAHDSSLTALAISPDGELIVSGSQDKSAKVWSSSTGELLQTLAHGATVGGVAISRDLILTGCHDKTAFIWDRKSGERKAAFEEASTWITAVALSADGTRAAIADDSGAVGIFDMGTMAKLRELRDHRGSVRTLVFSNGGKLASSSLDHTIRVYGEGDEPLLTIDLRRDEYLREQGEFVRSLAFSEDERALFIATSNSGVLRAELPSATPPR